METGTYNLSKGKVNGAKAGVYDVLLEKKMEEYVIISRNAGTQTAVPVPARTVEAWRTVGDDEGLSALIFPLIPNKKARNNLVSLIRQSEGSNLF